MRNWSYQELAREVRANLVYREFTRIGGGKVPDDKTMGRLGRQLGRKSSRKFTSVWWRSRKRRK
jgi:IS5 family transposase